MVRISRALLAVAAVAVGGTIAQPFRPIVVVGTSMSPTYSSGQILWTVPATRSLRHGDVVVVDTPAGTIIKRVALLPGDSRTQFHTPGGWVDLTNVALPHSLAKGKLVRLERVPKGYVYLLGDNLPNSVDSRTFGLVPIEQVRSVVVDSLAPRFDSPVAELIPQRWIALGTHAANL